MRSAYECYCDHKHNLTCLPCVQKRLVWRKDAVAYVDFKKGKRISKPVVRKKVAIVATILSWVKR